MVFIKHNSLKSDIFLIPYLFHAFQDLCFPGSRFFRVQVFQSPGFSGSRFFKVRLHDQGPGFRSSPVFMPVLQQVFSCEFCKTFQNNYFVKQLLLCTIFFFFNSANTYDVIRFYQSLQYKRYDRTLLKRHYLRMFFSYFEMFFCMKYIVKRFFFVII